MKFEEDQYWDSGPNQKASRGIHKKFRSTELTFHRKSWEMAILILSISLVWSWSSQRINNAIWAQFAWISWNSQGIQKAIHRIRNFWKILGNHESDPLDHAHLIFEFLDQVYCGFCHVIALLSTYVPHHKTWSSEYMEIVRNHKPDPFDQAYLIPKFLDQVYCGFCYVVAVWSTNVPDSQPVGTEIHGNQESDPSDLVTDQSVHPIWSPVAQGCSCWAVDYKHLVNRRSRIDFLNKQPKSEIFQPNC